jgi:topoisomerase-4 subunit A
MEIDAEQFIGQKSFKAKGKRITTLALATIEELEPTRLPEVPESEEGNADDVEESSEENGEENEPPAEPDDKKDEVQDAPPTPAREGHIDPLTGQFNLFDE